MFLAYLKNKPATVMYCKSGNHLAVKDDSLVELFLNTCRQNCNSPIFFTGRTALQGIPHVWDAAGIYSRRRDL
jgi:hypothetical protein